MIIVILKSKLVLINLCNKTSLFDFFSGTNYVIQKWNPARGGVGVSGLIILQSTQTLIVDESFRICHSSPNSETIGLIPPQKRDQLPKYPTKREHLFNEIAFSFFETYIREISKCLIESRNAVSIFKCISSCTLFCNCSWKKKTFIGHCELVTYFSYSPGVFIREYWQTWNVSFSEG